LTGLALPVSAQTTDADSAATAGGTTSSATFQSALSHLDRTIQSITGDRRIPTNTIAVVNTHWYNLDAGTQAQLSRAMTSQRESNLQDALGKAMVSTSNRPNGADGDQNTLRDYIISLGIDPKNVIAVDIASGGGEDPAVTVFYKGPSQGTTPPNQ